MRPVLRWQQFIPEYLALTRSGEFLEVHYDSASRRGRVTVRMILPDELPEGWVEKGTLVEFLDGFRVIGVAAVVGKGSPKDWSIEDL
jgi:hypothetical protein